MAVELSYLLIAPSCVRKGRFGPVMARVLSRTTADLVAVQSVPFPSPVVRDSARWLGGEPPPGTAEYDWQHWIKQSLSSATTDRPGCPGILLVFRGVDCHGETKRLLGGFGAATVDDSIRGTFGDFETAAGGRVGFCEPVGFGAASAPAVADDLRRFTEMMSSAGPETSGTAAGCERTLVLVKPDNFRHGGGRPGQVVDLFCRDGLALVGARLLRFSVRQAMEFYGPVREGLRTRLDVVAGEIAARELSGGDLGIAIDDRISGGLGRLLGSAYGEQRFQNLVKFMCGRAPDEADARTWDEPGNETTLALVFEGPDAVARMRAVLGPTDPSKAPRGTVRREFGSTLLENAGHASDSEENAAREIECVRPFACDLGGILAVQR